MYPMKDRHGSLGLRVSSMYNMEQCFHLLLVSDRSILDCYHPVAV